MTIVTAYTATAEGRAALDRATDEAVLRQATLVVVDLTAGPDGDGRSADHADEVGRTRRLLDARGLAVEIVRVRGLDAADAVVQAAQRADAELLVIGIRQRSPVGKLFLGSHAQRMLLTADCPVLAVKAGG